MRHESCSIKAYLYDGSTNLKHGDDAGCKANGVRHLALQFPGTFYSVEDNNVSKGFLSEGLAKRVGN